MRLVSIATCLIAGVACTSSPMPAPDTGPADQPDASGAIDAAEPVWDASGVDASLPPDGPAPPGDAGTTTTVPPEIDGRLVINEFMASNALTVLDETSAPSDWIEIYNPTATDVPLAGYRLTDDPTWIDKVILGDVTVPAGGYLLLWADRHPELGPPHVDLRLSREPEYVILARPDGTLIDRVAYGEQTRDLSAAREPDGSDHWVIEWHPSPGTANPAGPGAPVALENPNGPPEIAPAAGDISEQIMGYDAMPSIELLIDSSDIASLTAAPRTYVPAMLVYRGRAYGPVGARLKGQNSFLPIDEKPSLRLNIDYYVPHARFFGLDNMTLNNMSGDLSMMHERLAYRVARQAHVPASRSNHALVSINGEPYGLYANVETVKRELLARWFSDPSGTLFEATDVDFTPAYVGDYELESGANDRSLLIGLADALLEPDAGTALSQAASYVDLAQFRNFWAMCTIIGQFDSFPYSSPGDDYLLYADPTTQRLHFLPWGMDETFYSSSEDVTNVTSVLAQKCRASAPCFNAYVARVWQLLDVVEDDLDAQRQAVASQIAPHVSADTHRPYDAATVAEYQTQLRWFIQQRRDSLAAMLPPP